MYSQSSLRALAVASACVAGVLALSTGSSAAGSRSHASIKAALQAQYDKQDRGLEHKDIGTFMSILDPSYISTGKDLPREDYKAVHDAAKATFADIKWITAKTVIKSAWLTKSGAVSVAITSARTVGLDPKSGQAHKESIQETTRDYWIKVSGSWLINREEVLSMKTQSPTSSK